MTKGEKAKAFFLDGYNCSQAVALAFNEEINLPEEIISKQTIGFGGGVGRMREVCGSILGATYVLSNLYGESNKGDVYALVQQVSKRFKEENGSIICRELLGLSPSAQITAKPEERTQAYYKKRPCPEIVEICANILQEVIDENK